MVLFRWLILAVQFCTIVPTPNFRRAPTDDDAHRSVLFFPLVGIALGVLLWLIQKELRFILSPLPTATVAVLITTLITGGLHLDGLMDTADALGSRKRGEAALQIMKDSRVGAMGVIAGCFAILMKTATLASLPVSQPGYYLLVPCLSRAGMIISMNLAPYARSSGGLGALYTKRIPPWVIVCVIAWPIAVLLRFLPGLSWGPILVVTAITLAASVRFSCRRFNGMTGDTYGALQELLEVVGYLTALAMVRSITL